MEFDEEFKYRPGGVLQIQEGPPLRQRDCDEDEDFNDGIPSYTDFR